MTAIIKIFELRDEGTTMPIIAIKPHRESESTRWCWARSGYGTKDNDQQAYILMARLAGGDGILTCDPYKHGTNARTLRVGHEWLLKHDNFMALDSGDVIDVQHILGETETRKRPEREEVLDQYLHDNR